METSSRNRSFINYMHEIRLRNKNLDQSAFDKAQTGSKFKPETDTILDAMTLESARNS